MARSRGRPLQGRLLQGGVRLPSGVRGRPARITRYRRRLIPRPVRAAWYHAAALLREFRLPIFGFLFLTVVGGFAYGELYEALRGDDMPIIDRPYVIVQLEFEGFARTMGDKACN